MRAYFLVGLSLLLLGNIPRGGAGVTRGGYVELEITEDSTFVIDASSQWHALIGSTSDEMAGDMATHVGTRVDLAGATFATAGGGAQTQITGVAHGKSLNDIVTITGSSDAAQNGVAQVVAVGGATDFTVDIAFSSNPVTKGFVTHGDHVEIANPGVYVVMVSMATLAQTGTLKADFGIYINKTLDHEISQTFANATDTGPVALVSLVTVSTAGDEVWVGLKNNTNGNDLTIEELDFVVVRVW